MTCLLFCNSLCGKLVLSLKLLIIVDGHFSFIFCCWLWFILMWVRQPYIHTVIMSIFYIDISLKQNIFIEFLQCLLNLKIFKHVVAKLYDHAYKLYYSNILLRKTQNSFLYLFKNKYHMCISWTIYNNLQNYWE